FNTAKGYGFVTPDAGGDDLFAHVSELNPNTNPNDLREGVRVDFVVREGRKGPQAEDVIIIHE
ncbi:MAG: hypothetical protein GF381_01195, partial [Candidatus Pacebacteria bacterium]|nr:hypothetical protein [Candidatus Paceibacterota bacterium]